MKDEFDLALRPVVYMMTRDPICATATTTVLLAIQMMLNHKISGLPVVDRQGRLIGIYSEYDAMIQGASGSLDEVIRYVSDVTSLPDTSTLKEALTQLGHRRFRRLPVIDSGGKLIGIVARRDLIKILHAEYTRKAKAAS